MADKLIYVKSGRDDDRVVLWERDESHPNGEAYVAGSRAVQVAETGAVKAKLASGELVTATAAEAKPEAAK